MKLLQKITLCALLLSTLSTLEARRLSGYSYVTPFYPLSPCGEFIVEGEYLLFHPKEDNLLYATTIGVAEDGLEKQRNLHDVHFQWSSGFRVKLGYNLAEDCWAMNACWTNLDSHASGHTDDFVIEKAYATTFYDILDARPYLPGSFAANADWHLEFNQIDFTLTRFSKVGPNIVLSPYFGGRYLSIQQKMETCASFDSTDDSTHLLSNTHLKNDFQGLGFTGGLNTIWRLFEDLSVFGDMGGSILYGDFSINSENRATNSGLGTETILFLPDSFNAIRATLDFASGFEYRISYCEENEVFIKVAGEMHLYFDQNQFPVYKPTRESGDIVTHKEGDFGFYGVTASLGFTF